MPSLFFVAAAAAREGRSLGAADLARIVREDAPRRHAASTSPSTARSGTGGRVRTGGREAVAGHLRRFGFLQAVAPERRRPAGRASLRPTTASSRSAPRDGVTTELAAEIARRLDPVTAPSPDLGQPPRRLRPLRLPVPPGVRAAPGAGGGAGGAPAPGSARARQPLPRGGGAIPAGAARPRRAAVARHGAGAAAPGADGGRGAGRARHGQSPPRFTALWAKERARFQATMRDWFRLRGRERPASAVPAHFELGFGLSRRGRAGRAPSPGAARHRPRRRAHAARVREDRPHRPARRTGRSCCGDYKTGRAPARRRRPLPRRPAAPDPVLHPGRRPHLPGRRRWWRRSSTTWTAGGRSALDPALVHCRLLPRSAARPGGRDRARACSCRSPTACEWCDFTVVCGPTPLLERRRQLKLGDPRIQQVLRLRDAT